MVHQNKHISPNNYVLNQSLKSQTMAYDHFPYSCPYDILLRIAPYDI